MAHLDRLARLLPHALLLWVASAFLLPTDAAYALVFYVVVPPCLLASFAGREKGQGLCPCTPPGIESPGPLYFAILLIVWSAATLVWGTDDGNRAVRSAVSVAATLAFVLACYRVFRFPIWVRRLGILLIALGTASATFCVCRFFLHPPPTLPTDTPRLRGWGITHSLVLGASVMAVPMLTALFRALAPEPHMTRKTRALFAAAAAIMALDIVLTKSRMPITAAFIAALFLCVATRHHRFAVALLAAPFAAAALFPEVVRAALARPLETARIDIWRESLREIAQHPWLGHGLAAQLTPAPGVDATFPHSLYLSLLFYGGIPALLLFIAIAWGIFWRMLSSEFDDSAAWRISLLLAALIAGATDDGQVTKGPGELWIILWIPLCLAAAQARPSAK